MSNTPRKAWPGDPARQAADRYYAISFEIEEPTPDEQRRGVTRRWNGMPVTYVIDFLGDWTGNAFIEVDGYTPWATKSPAEAILYWIDTREGFPRQFLLSTDELRAQLPAWQRRYRRVANQRFPAKMGLLVPIAELEALQLQPKSKALADDDGWLRSFNSFNELLEQLNAPRPEDEWMIAFPDEETATNWLENYDPD